jgi:HPt (histidine-containing phosphotransfer) domain-containing protein
LRENAFDLVLIDAELAEADDWAAVKAVRRSGAKEGPPIPILVVADTDDEDAGARFLGAGLDGVVTRPIAPDRLLETVQRVWEARMEHSDGSPSPRPGPQRPARDPPAIDRAMAVQRLGGDESVLFEMAGLFLEQCPELVEQVRRAVARRDPQRIEQAAHRFKSSVSNFFAKEAFEAAQALEAMARQGMLDDVQEACDRFVRAVDQLQPVLKDLARQG